MLAGRIKEYIPEAVILYNQVPKNWHSWPIYMQLIPNDDPNQQCYFIQPRGGAFELSTVAEDGKNPNADILLFSKILGKMWPSCGDVGRKMAKYWECKQEGEMTP